MRQIEVGILHTECSSEQPKVKLIPVKRLADTSRSVCRERIRTIVVQRIQDVAKRDESLRVPRVIEVKPYRGNDIKPAEPIGMPRVIPIKRWCGEPVADASNHATGNQREPCQPHDTVATRRQTLLSHVPEDLPTLVGEDVMMQLPNGLVLIGEIEKVEPARVCLTNIRVHSSPKSCADESAEP